MSTEIFTRKSVFYNILFFFPQLFSFMNFRSIAFPQYSTESLKTFCVGYLSVSVTKCLRKTASKKKKSLFGLPLSETAVHAWLDLVLLEF